MKKLLFLIILIFNYADAKELFNVKTIDVKLESISDIKSFYGYAVLDESLIFDKTLRFDGFIENLKVNKEYQYIKKGDLLFSIYSSDIYLAQSELINSANNRAIQDSLYKKLSLLGIDRAFAQSILKTKQPKELVPIYSDREGFIIKKNINDGSFIKKGELIYQIADLSKLWVIAKVYEDDIDFVKNSNLVHIKFDNLELDSKVDFIYPKVNLESKTIDVRIKIENDNLEIFPNSFAKIDFHQNAKNILTLPSSAVITKGSKHYVFIKSEFEGEYDLKSITAYRISNKKFQILKGLKKGDIVANNALFMLDSDVQINGSDW